MPAIAVHHLRFTYPKAASAAVEGMDFTVEQGEIFGFLGPSGAGKSTTQKILVGLLRGWSGEVAVLGRPLGSWGPGYYERVGVGFELPNHFGKLTARENLAFFGRLSAAGGQEPALLLERLGLAAAADQRVSAFSKGMKMRLNLARALLHRPDLLFLDEPTAGLDPANARTVKELVREQRQAGRTVFLTTHDLGVAQQLCDRVAFVVEGRIAALDTPTALTLRAGARRVRVAVAEPDGGLTTHEFALEGLADDAAFQALLRSGAVETIHTTEASLEDVFVQVTGRALT